jgi:hypothetical protein
MLENNIPLSSNNVKVVYSDLDWSEFLWGTDFLQIRGQKAQMRVAGLKTLKWYDNTI